MQTLSLPSANGLFRDLVVSNWEILLDGQPMLVKWAPIGRLKDGEFRMLSNFQKRVRWFLDKAKHYNAHIIIDEKTQLLSDLEWAFKNKDTSTATTSILVMFQKLLGVEIKEAKVIASQAWIVQDEVAMVVAIEAVKDAFAWAQWDVKPVAKLVVPEVTRRELTPIEKIGVNFAILRDFLSWRNHEDIIGIFSATLDLIEQIPDPIQRQANYESFFIQFADIHYRKTGKHFDFETYEKEKWFTNETRSQIAAENKRREDEWKRKAEQAVETARLKEEQTGYEKVITAGLQFFETEKTRAHPSSFASQYARVIDALGKLRGEKKKEYFVRLMKVSYLYNYLTGKDFDLGSHIDSIFDMEALSRILIHFTFSWDKKATLQDIANDSERVQLIEVVLWLKKKYPQSALAQKAQELESVLIDGGFWILPVSIASQLPWYKEYNASLKSQIIDLQSRCESTKGTPAFAANLRAINVLLAMRNVDKVMLTHISEAQRVITACERDNLKSELIELQSRCFNSKGTSFFAANLEAISLLLGTKDLDEATQTFVSQIASWIDSCEREHALSPYVLNLVAQSELVIMGTLVGSKDYTDQKDKTLSLVSPFPIEEASTKKKLFAEFARIENIHNALVIQQEMEGQMLPKLVTLFEDEKFDEQKKAIEARIWEISAQEEAVKKLLLGQLAKVCEERDEGIRVKKVAAQRAAKFEGDAADKERIIWVIWPMVQGMLAKKASDTTADVKDEYSHLYIKISVAVKDHLWDVDFLGKLMEYEASLGEEYFQHILQYQTSQSDNSIRHYYRLSMNRRNEANTLQDTVVSEIENMVRVMREDFRSTKGSVLYWRIDDTVETAKKLFAEDTQVLEKLVFIIPVLDSYLDYKARFESREAMKQKEDIDELLLWVENTYHFNLLAPHNFYRVLDDVIRAAHTDWDLTQWESYKRVLILQALAQQFELTWSLDPRRYEQKISRCLSITAGYEAWKKENPGEIHPNFKVWQNVKKRKGIGETIGGILSKLGTSPQDIELTQTRYTQWIIRDAQSAQVLIAHLQNDIIWYQKNPKRFIEVFYDVVRSIEKIGSVREGYLDKLYKNVSELAQAKFIQHRPDVAQLPEKNNERVEIALFSGELFRNAYGANHLFNETQDEAKRNTDSARAIERTLSIIAQAKAIVKGYTQFDRLLEAYRQLTVSETIEAYNQICTTLGLPLLVEPQEEEDEEREELKLAA